MGDSIGSWATSSLAHCLNAVSTGTYVSHSFLFWTLGAWDEIISLGVCYVFCPKNIKKGAVWVVLGVFSFFVNCINLVSLLVECHKLFSHCNNLLQTPLKKKAWIKKFASSNIWILVFFFVVLATEMFWETHSFIVLHNFPPRYHAHVASSLSGIMPIYFLNVSLL